MSIEEIPDDCLSEICSLLSEFSDFHALLFVSKNLLEFLRDRRPRSGANITFNCFKLPSGSTTQKYVYKIKLFGCMFDQKDDVGKIFPNLSSVDVAVVRSVENIKNVHLCLENCSKLHTYSYHAFELNQSCTKLLGNSEARANELKRFWTFGEKFLQGLTVFELDGVSVVFKFSWLENFNHLQKLVFRNGHFRGWLDLEKGNEYKKALEKLVHFDVRYADGIDSRILNYLPSNRIETLVYMMHNHTSNDVFWKSTIREFVKLKILKIRNGCDELSDGAFESFTGLENLSITENTHLSEAVIRNLAKMRKPIKSLVISNMGRSFSGNEIHRFKKLRKLTLWNMRVSGECFKTIEGLERLTLCAVPNVTELHFEYLSNLKILKISNLNFNQFCGEMFKHLRKLRSLKLSSHYTYGEKHKECGEFFRNLTKYIDGLDELILMFPYVGIFPVFPIRRMEIIFASTFLVGKMFDCVSGIKEICIQLTRVSNSLYTDLLKCGDCFIRNKVEMLEVRETRPLTQNLRDAKMCEVPKACSSLCKFLYKLESMKKFSVLSKRFGCVIAFEK